MPLILPALCFGLAAALFLPRHGAWWLWLSALAAVLALALWRRRRGGGSFQAACCLAAALSGCIYALARTDYALSQRWPAEIYPQAVLLRVEITGLPQRDEDGRTRFTARAYTADGRGYTLLFQDFSRREWLPGEVWQLRARVRAPLGARNPVGFDREGWALANGIDGLASAGSQRFRLPETRSGAAWSFNRMRLAASRNWRQADDYPRGAALMAALAVGDGSGLPPQVWASFRPLGINHLISISGLHISMVGVLAGWLFKQLLRLLPRLPARPRVWQSAAGLAAAAFYTGLAGFEIPALRSLIMLTVFAAAWAWRGSLSGWQVWWAALSAVLLYQPASVLAPGFWLSFGLVAALMWVLAFRLPEHGRWAALKQAAAGQWAAMLLGALATVRLFGTLPPFSAPVNALAIPFFSWLLVPLALAASALPFDSLRTAAAWLAEQTVALLLWLGERLPEYGFAAAPLPLFVLALGAALLWLLPRGLRLRPAALALLVMFFAYRPPPSGSLKAEIVDVGQGLAVLLQTPSHTLLFDTGTPASGQTLLPVLHAHGVRRIDTLVLSHHDSDHDGGYPAVRRQFAVGKLWAGQPEFYPQARYCRDGIRWQADGVLFEFVTPPPQKGEDNDASCVLRAVYGTQALMITGDLGFKGEDALLQRYGSDIHSQILVLGHHGSRHASGSAFLNTVAPELAVASSGFANSFKHPHPEVQLRLRAHRIRLLRTDTQGAISLDIRPDGFQAASHPRGAWWQSKPFLPPPEP